MASSRRGRIIELLNEGKLDEDILKVIDVEFTPGTFSTSNKQALYGTKWDLGKSGKRPKSQSNTIKDRSNTKKGSKGRPSSNFEYTLSQLIDQLKYFTADPVIEHYKASFLEGKKPNEILKFSVDNTIYRAFHYETPSQRYLKWKWHKTPEKLVEKLDGVSIQEEYDNLLYEVAYSLVDDWGEVNERNEPTRMNIGVALKIVNLIMKHLSFSSNTINPKLIQWLHVPWDSYTLKPLRRIWRLNPPIPLNASQGFVNSLELYKNLHKFISEIAMHADKPRIYYEFLVWDRSHQNLYS